MKRCLHRNPIPVETGQLLHAFCGGCGAWIKTVIHPEINSVTFKRVFAPPEGVADRFDRAITVDGVARTMREWAKACGVEATTIYKRIVNGWSEREACLSPAGERLGRVRKGRGAVGLSFTRGAQ